MKYDTKLEACRAWVSEMNAIPQAVVDKLMRYDENDFQEVTPLTKYDRVSVYCDKYRGHGEIVDVKGDKYFVRTDDDRDDYIECEEDELSAEYEDSLPMWGTMWAFGDNIDNEWLSGEFGENGLQKMADCGFRIYESEDYGYVFGIDGAGYDFYESHWLPLYDARGLHWHKEEA